ncbi:hypothetical protein J6590_091758 [Homalodisca vitripennis]|nr:hypothetical protein J6590_091758 [Homalodisca vitripennis]
MSELHKHKIKLTEGQKRKMRIAYKKRRSAVIGIAKDQLSSSGEDSVPYGKKFVSPLVRRKIAPLLKEQLVPWLKNLIDNELDSIIEKDPSGNGVRKRIDGKLLSLFKKHS